LHYAVGMALANWACALVMTCQLEAARRVVQEGIAYSTQRDDYHLAIMLAYQAQIKLYQARWTEAAALLQQIMQRPDFERVLQVDAMLTLGRLGVRRGDAGAERRLRETRALYAEADSHELLGFVRAGLAEAAWLSGDNRRAAQEAGAVYDRAAGQHVPWLVGELSFWRWRAGEVFTPPDWIARPYALQISGDWRGAASEWETRGCPYEQAMALMDGDKAAQLAALEIFEGLGAHPILTKLKQKLRAEGVRRIPRGPRPATRQHRFGLTSREMEILSCLVKGPTNTDIARQLGLSTRTVEHHIESMFQKTGVQSRQELVALALKESLLSAE
jgi:DNA-binding CsgD family transcriptional regulator